jgi:Kdo2-lipid IVA lauroyltransferase/acyltransferase
MLTRRCAIVLLLSRAFSALPLPVALAVGRLFGWVWYYLLPIRLGVARQNIRRVFGTTLSRRAQRRLLRRSINHWSMYGVESLRLPALSADVSQELIELRGTEHLAAALERGRGVIAVTAHVGCFDTLACGLAVRGIPFAVIFKEISWKPANDFWFAVRRASGIKVIAPRRSKEEIRTALERNETVAFTVDQHMAKHRAMVCEFFGHLAATSPAPARFALETGAALLPLHIERGDKVGHHVVTIEPLLALEQPYAEREANIRHNTERLNRIIEGWIRRVPEQWLWLHRRWKVHDAPDGWPIPPELLARYQERTRPLGPH